jgi:hypothetical protein
MATRYKVVLSDQDMQSVKEIVLGQQSLYKPHKDASVDIEKWTKTKLMDAGGKFAVAHHFNLPVNIGEDGRIFGPRLPSGPVLVRTMPKEWGDLILHNSDKDYRLFVLVYNKGHEFHLLGWCRGDEGKKTEYWKDPTKSGKPAYFVPQSALRDINDLLTPVAQRSKP